MDMPTASTLFRKYLAKIHPDMRLRVLGKEWRIDGADRPPRQVANYRDVAIAAGLLLEERADIYAAGNQSEYPGES